MQRTHTIVLSALFAAAALPAHAEQVRWINPQGGSFAFPANWSPQRVPLPTDTAVFDLAATYSVTLAADRVIQNCLITAGNVTLDLAAHNLTTQSITCSAGSASIADGLVHGRAVTTGGTLTVLADAEFDRGGSASTDGQLIIHGVVGKQGDNAGTLTINTGAFARLEPTGSIVSRTLSVNGTLEINAGEVNAEALFVRGHLDVDAGHIQCEMNPQLLLDSKTYLTNGAILAVTQQGAEVLGEMLLDGQGTSASVKLVKGWLRIESGAEAHPSNTEMSAAEMGRVEVGPGGILNGIFYRSDLGTLRLEPGSTGPVGGLDSYGFFTDTRLELVVDALATPCFLPRGFRTQATPFECEFAGTLVVEVENPNVLRIGKTIPLFTSQAPLIGGNFSNVILPTLGGGRALEVSITPTQVFLHVVAGGPPCWTADFNGDGSEGTDEDILAFFACLGGNCCETCGEADFNTDGDYGTDQDIEAFFRVLSGDPC